MTTDNKEVSAPEGAATNDAPSFPEAPAKSKPDVMFIFTQARTAFDSMVEAVTAANAVKGSIGQFTARAKSDIDSIDLPTLLDMMGDDLIAESTVADLETALVAFRDAHLKALTSDLTPRREAAESAYAEARSDWDAILRFAKGDTLDALKGVMLPNLPGKSSVPKSATVKGDTVDSKIRYWRQPKGGEKSYQGPAKLATLAFQQCGELNPDGDNGSVGTLVAYASSKGVNVQQTTEAWTLELPSGKQIGMEVLD